jgi:hypothetical protein
MEEIYSSFNRKLRELVEIVKSESNEEVIQTLDRKIKLALMTDKSLPLTECGSDLYKLRNDIMNDKWDGIISYDWENAVDETNYTIEEMDANTIKYTIRVIKKVWKKLSDEDQSRVKSILKRLVSNYAKWLIAKQ